MKIVTEVYKTGIDYTISKLYIDTVYQCYIMEDVMRKQKVFGKTAIPRGIYDIVITESTRFKRLLPLLVDVENYSGVRIHPGNIPEDTEGCLLPGLNTGMVKGEFGVLQSREAFEMLFKKIQTAFDKEEHITIELR